MCRAENETVSHIVSECKMLTKRNIKKGMTMYADIFIEDYAKSMSLKEQLSITSMSQMELLRTKCTRFYGILRFSVISRLKIDDQILLLLIKPRRS